MKIRTLFAALGIMALMTSVTSAAIMCPQGYATDAVTLKLSTEISSSVPSTTIGITAMMQNTSSATIQDAVIVVDVRAAEDTQTIADRFVASQHVTILANSSAEIDYEWNVPSDLTTGVYVMRATLVPAETPRAEAFTHAIGPTAELFFDIRDAKAGSASIISASVSGSAYDQQAPATFSEVTPVVPIALMVENADVGPYIGALHWKVYAGDATFLDEPITVRDDVVELHPGTSAMVRYEMTQLSRPAYYVEAELAAGGGHRFYDIWLQRDGADAFKSFSCTASLDGGRSVSGTMLMSLILVVILIALAGVGALLQRRLH